MNGRLTLALAVTPGVTSRGQGSHVHPLSGTSASDFRAHTQHLTSLILNWKTPLRIESALLQTTTHSNTVTAGEIGSGLCLRVGFVMQGQRSSLVTVGKNQDEAGPRKLSSVRNPGEIAHVSPRGQNPSPEWQATLS